MHTNRLTTERIGQSAILRLELADDFRTLNPEMLYDVSQAFDEVLRDPAIETICLSSIGADFLSGADAKFFARCILDSDMESLGRFTSQANQLLQRIEQSSKPVIAWIRGTTMGAGLELAMACRAIVAGPKAKFAFPETGLGIYPGMGGTQRARRLGAGLGKWMIYTGSIVPADHAVQIGLIDLVRPDTEGPAEIIAAATSVTRSPRTREARFQSLETLFGNHTVVELCDSAFPQPAEPQAIRALVQLRGKSRSALMLAEQIIDRGLRMSLDEGLAEEFSHLNEAFTSPDARRGLLAAAGLADPRSSAT